MRKEQELKCRVFGSAWVHWLGTESGPAHARCTVSGAARRPANPAKHGKPITGPSEGHAEQVMSVPA